MLFQKKKKFDIQDAQIKEEIKSSDGTVLLKMNIRYPEIICDKKDPLYNNAKNIYPRLAKALEEYSKNELYKKALKAYNLSKENFVPYGLIMRWENTFMYKLYLSILLEISINDGINTPLVERKTQIWNRTDGQKCCFNDFFAKTELKTMFSHIPKGFSKEFFVLRESCYEFYVPNQNEFAVFKFQRES